MYKPQPKERTAPMFWELESMLDSHHELYVLANMIEWDVFEKAFAPLFKEDNGRPAKPIRLMTGLLILKHLRNVSDETVVDQFKENAYYQYFCGETAFTTAAPCASSELVHFRHRIKGEGMELILRESIRVNLSIEDARKKEKDEKDRIRFLYKRIKAKKATKREKDEYMCIMHQEGLISDEQYRRYIKGGDNDWLIALAVLAGAAFIAWGVNQINK